MKTFTSEIPAKIVSNASFMLLEGRKIHLFSEVATKFSATGQFTDFSYPTNIVNFIPHTLTFLEV